MATNLNEDHIDYGAEVNYERTKEAYWICLALLIYDDLKKRNPGLCLQNLEVIKPASGGPTCVVLSGKSVHSSVLKRLCTDISSVSMNALFLITTPVKEENNWL